MSSTAAPPEPVPPGPLPRVVVLQDATALISGDRNNTYGPPTQDFARTAGVLTALGYRSPHGDVQPHDVAVIAAALKLSRLMWSPLHRDNWVDLAGYAGCGFECAQHHLPDPSSEAVPDG